MYLRVFFFPIPRKGYYAKIVYSNYKECGEKIANVECFNSSDSLVAGKHRSGISSIRKKNTEECFTQALADTFYHLKEIRCYK